MEIDAELRARVQAWIDDDPDPDTRAELTDLLAAGDATELADRFRGTLAFGTAGLRGVLGGGPNRMNRAVVIRATAGLCAWVKDQVPDAATRGVCIGFDGRRKSRQMAEDAAAVVAGAGLVAHVFEVLVPTPVLAFSLRDVNAAAGIMVTASHNPPEYNGYKVYWENAAQIIPPHDAGIADRIAVVGPIAAIPMPARAEAEAAGRRVTLGDDVVERYFDGVRALMVHPEADRSLRIAYTALHGVGERYARRAFADAGFTEVHSVPAQAEPDGEFPTVAFPNPEEKGAMDLVLELAGDVEADLVLANDPDADRLAVSVRNDADGYVSLTGNEIGCLLAHYLLEATEGDDRLVVSSVVSSPMLGAIARAHGARWVQTLTGFKWIANEALRLSASDGLRFLFGYEEALGYTVGTLVRDKDGVSAAAVMADMAAWCRSRGVDLLSERETMWRRYGMFLSRQVSVMMDGHDARDRIAAAIDRVRAEPPAALAELTVSSFADLERGVRRGSDGSETETGFPPSDVLLFDLEGGHRVMLRPSGTEPKLKLYFDVNIAMSEGESVDDARDRGIALLDALAIAMRSRTGV